MSEELIKLGIHGESPITEVNNTKMSPSTQKIRLDVWCKLHLILNCDMSEQKTEALGRAFKV